MQKQSFGSHTESTRQQLKPRAASYERNWGQASMDPESGRRGEEIRPGVWSRGRRQSDPRTPSRPPMRGETRRRRPKPPDRYDDGKAKRPAVGERLPRWRRSGLCDALVLGPHYRCLSLCSGRRLSCAAVYAAGLVGVDAPAGSWARRRRRRRIGQCGDKAMGRTEKKK